MRLFLGLWFGLGLTASAAPNAALLDKVRTVGSSLAGVPLHVLSSFEAVPVIQRLDDIVPLAADQQFLQDPPKVGDPAPDFELLNLKEDVVALKQFRGRVVLIDFWASWCGPCRNPVGLLNHLHNGYGEKGLKILSINFGESREMAQRYVDANGILYEALLDSKNTTLQAYGVRALPHFLLIGHDGIILWEKTGYVSADDEEIEREVKSALEQLPEEETPA